jgi:hypothetical protein
MKDKLLLVFLAVVQIQTFAQEKNKTRYFNISSFSYQWGIGYVRGYVGSTSENDVSTWSLHTVNGIKHRSSAFGLGAGYEQWDNSFLIPLYFRYQVFFKDINPLLFEYFDAGYAFGTAKKQTDSDPEEQGRFLFRIGLGSSFKLDSKYSLSLSSFYQLQRTNVNYYKGDYLTIYSFIGISIGVMFY